MLGEILHGKPEKGGSTPSAYQPPADVLELTKEVKKYYEKGDTILHKPYPELNNYSIVGRMNKDKRAFNSYVDENTDDPKESWKWRGTRGMARNKAMTMHAHTTATLAVPMAFAQNDQQEEDRDASNVMRDALMWMATNPTSEYQGAYLAVNLASMYNPVSYLGAEYCEVQQTIRERGEDGKIQKKEVLDEVLSGFKSPVYSPDQILITNAYIQNIQRQPAILKKRLIEYSEAKVKYGEHPNWNFVQPGIKAIYSDEDGLFYDISDQELQGNLVEEVTFLSRLADTEVCYLNGIYMGDENVEANPIKHRDNRNAPKYNFVPFGYERINEHFFFYKSLMNRIGWDNALIDATYENTMNRDILDLYPPLAISGAENSDNDVIFPGGMLAFENPDAEMKPILPPNRVAGYQALREIEKSISEASQSEVAGGSLPDKDQKAFNVARAEQNSRTILRAVFRSTAESVVQYGSLMVDIFLQHYTTAQLDEITGAAKYRPFILQDQMVNGRKVSKKIVFDEALIGREMSKKERKYKSLDLLTEAGYPNEKEHIYRVNPHLFSKLKYLVRLEADVLMEKNEALEKEMTERLYTLLRQDPLISSEALVRDLANTHWRGRAEDFIAKQPAVPQLSTPGVLPEVEKGKQGIGQLGRGLQKMS